MSGQADPYIRVYYSIINDPKFEVVYPSDGMLATWLRLLLVADALHPASAPIPRGTRRAPLTHLVDVGLVELVGSGQFRMHGLAAERARRGAAGREAAYARWNADALQTHSAEKTSAMLAEPSRAEPRRVTPKPPRRGLRKNGQSPRQLREGSPSIDAGALQRLGELLPRTDK